LADIDRSVNCVAVPDSPKSPVSTVMEADALGLSSFQRCMSSIPLSKSSHSSEPAMVQLSSGSLSPGGPLLASLAASTVWRRRPSPDQRLIHRFRPGRRPCRRLPCLSHPGFAFALRRAAMSSSPIVNADLQVAINIFLTIVNPGNIRQDKAL
jgi:hypothetical protein